jgi:hypothetical protein
MEMAMPNLRRRMLLLAAVNGAAILLGAQRDVAKAEAPPAGRRIALSGYDPVSYFTEGQPAKGTDAFWFAFDDATYLFRSAEHRAMFAADPERYAPQYAGFCAAGVSKGYKTEPDPEAWVIANGKLYVLQLKERVADFKRDTAAFVDKASANWPGLKDAPVR